jgi:restriction endonuclease S subunit
LSAKNIDIARLAQGNSVVHLYSTHLKTLKISLPITEEQNRIADFVRNVSMKIESIQIKTNQTQQFKKGLLQQMFV